MALSDTQQTTVTEPSQFASRLAGRIAAVVLALLLLMSLISYNSDDLQVLAHGVGSEVLLKNWIGRFGAYLSGILIAWLGLGVYPTVLLVVTCLLARVFGTPSRKLNILYISVVVVFCLGVSMCLGVFPNMLAGICEPLNLSQTPGGAIGQRFCSPGVEGAQMGWLSYIVNPIGSVIISSAMMILGLVTVWFFDWQDTTKVAWARLLELLSAKREKIAEELQVRAEERAKVREATMQIRAAEAEIASANRAATPAPAAAAKPKAKTKPKKAVAAAAQPELPTSDGKLVGGKDETASPKKPLSDYVLPTIDMLDPIAAGTVVDPKELAQKKVTLQETLESFGIDAQVGDVTSGPRVTLFEVKPGPGVKVERITGLANNIAMNLRAESLRIQAPIPGRDSIGIEVPNSTAAIVGFRELLESKVWRDTKAQIPIGLGKNIRGEHVVLDLARCPHLMIAGATGAGKSVCMNTLILSLLYRFSPLDLKLIMVDPKVVEFSGYNTLPHLVTPVVTDVKKVPIALRWAVNQMEWRYKILAKAGVRNIVAYNTRKQSGEILDDEGKPIPERLPYVVIIIDELADIMMTARGDVETSLARIAQLARAVGIHTVIATQRPSVDVLTGLIKANFPTRIAFQVSSLTDSRTILDGKGAETLLGRGDMLFKPPGGSKLERTQGAMVDDEEIERVVTFVSDQASPEFSEDIFSGAEEDDDGGGKPAKSGGGSGGGRPSAGRVPGPSLAAAQSEMQAEADEGSDESLIKQAIQIILRDQRATTSHVQRRLRIGYNRAALIIEELERRGIIGPQIGTAPREILIVDENEFNPNASSDDDASAEDDDPLEAS